MGKGFNGKVMAHPVGLFCLTGPLVGGPSRIHSDKLDGYDGVTTCVFTAISCGRCCTVLVQVGLKASAHAIFLAIHSYVFRYPFTSDKVYRRSTAHQEVNQGQRLTTLEGVGRHAFGSLRCWSSSWKYRIAQRGIYGGSLDMRRMPEKSANSLLIHEHLHQKGSTPGDSSSVGALVFAHRQGMLWTPFKDTLPRASYIALLTGAGGKQPMSPEVGFLGGFE